MKFSSHLIHYKAERTSGDSIMEERNTQVNIEILDLLKTKQLADLISDARVHT